MFILLSPFFMHVLRFGGGSELLRDGDAGDVWSIIEHGMVYVLPA